jgi:hypothetical protein
MEMGMKNRYRVKRVKPGPVYGLCRVRDMFTGRVSVLYTNISRTRAIVAEMNASEHEGYDASYRLLWA